MLRARAMKSTFFLMGALSLALWPSCRKARKKQPASTQKAAQIKDCKLAVSKRIPIDKNNYVEILEWSNSVRISVVKILGRTSASGVEFASKNLVISKEGSRIQFYKQWGNAHNARTQHERYFTMEQLRAVLMVEARLKPGDLALICNPQFRQAARKILYGAK